MKSKDRGGMNRFADARVGVVCGGRSNERPVSLETGESMYRALEKKGYNVEKYIFPEQISKVIEDDPSAVILALHGRSDEGGGTQGFFETLGIPYSGSGVLASALAMDKRRAKVLFRHNGLSPPRELCLDLTKQWEPEGAIDSLESQTYGYPVVVKPNKLGSSVGIDICRTSEQLAEVLRAWRVADGIEADELLIEEFIEGTEYTVGFFKDECLGVMEVIPHEGFYDYESKYASSETKYEPVESGQIYQLVRREGKVAFDALGCRGVGRVDFRLEKQDSGWVPRILEVNTIPGMTETSLVPKMAASMGIDFPDFVEWTLSAARLDEGD